MKILSPLKFHVTEFWPNNAYKVVWFKWKGIVFKCELDRKDVFCDADMVQWTPMEQEHLAKDTGHLLPAAIHGMGPLQRAKHRQKKLDEVKQARHDKEKELEKLLGLGEKIITVKKYKDPK